MADFIHVMKNGGVSDGGLRGAEEGAIRSLRRRWVFQVSLKNGSAEDQGEIPFEFF